jgi:hypothetical protein
MIKNAASKFHFGLMGDPQQNFWTTPIFYIAYKIVINVSNALSIDRYLIPTPPSIEFHRKNHPPPHGSVVPRVDLHF